MGLLQHAARLAQHDLALAGDHDVPAVALEQRDPQQLLGLADLTGERRLRDGTGGCGAAEMAMLAHGHEIFEIAKG